VARRRRSRRRRSDAKVVLVLGGLLAAYWAAVQAYRWVLGHRVTAVGIAAGVVAVGVFALRVWWRRRRGRRAAVRRLASLGDGTGKAAEELVAELLRRDGCTGVEVRGGGGDLGADVTGMLPGGGRVVVQVKDYAKPIGSPALQTFNGTCWSEHGADVAVFVTTSSFTSAAVAFAGRSGIELVDGAGLAAWMAGESMGRAA
jgi:restriction system protein